MLMKMVTVEVRVQLESHAIADDTADVLSAAFALVELAITFLTDDGNYDGSAESHAEADVGLASANSSSASSASHAWAALPSAVLLSLQRDFTELFGAVFIYLGDQRDDAAPPSPVALACVRALGAWLAEETGGGALRDRFVDVLPYLLEITDVGAALGGVGGGYVNDGVEGGSDDDDGKVDAAADSGHRSLMLEAAAQDALSYLLSGLGAVMADHADVCAIAVAHRVHSRALAMIVLASDEADAALKRGVASSSIASASAASSYLSVSAAAALSAAIATARVNLGEVAAAAVVVRAMLSAANADAARVLVCGPASSSSSSSMLQHVPTVYRLFVALGELSLSDSEIDAGVLRAANHCRAQLVALMLQMVIHCPAAANLSLPLRTLLWGQSLPAASAFVAIAHPPASASSSFWSGVVACLAQRAARREFDDAFLAAIEALLVDCSDGTGSPSSSFALPIAAAVAGGALVPALLHAAANIAASSGAVSDGADSDDDDDENEDEERAAIADLDALLATVLLSSAPASGIASSSTSGSGSGAVADAVARHVHVEMKLRPALARALPQTMARV